MDTAEIDLKLKKDRVGLPQQVALMDGTVWSLTFDANVRGQFGQPWRYTQNLVGVEMPVKLMETKTLTELSRTVGIRRVLRDAEGRLR